MKTFKQFTEDNQYVSEGAGALIGGALKLGGKALAAYSAYKTGESLAQGKPKEAAINSIGIVPGGKVFKGMKALGAGKNLSRLGSTAQSIARYGTDNPFSRGVDKAYSTAGKIGKKLYNTIRK